MRNILCVVVMLISTVSFGQKKDSIFYERIDKIETELDDLLFGNLPQKRFDNRLEYIQNLNKKNLENYNEFLRTFPDSEYTFSALNGKAYTEYSLKNYDTAKEAYLKVLEFINTNKGKTDPRFGFVFGEQNERFINEIYLKLVEIEQLKKNYKQALMYLDEAQKNSYRISCANALYPEIAHIAASYSECYFNLNHEKKVLDVLIPIAALPIQNEGSVNVTRLYEILLKKYTKKELKKLFEESFKTLHSKEGTINNYFGTIYYVKFLNRDVILYDSFKNLSKKKIKEKLNTNLNYSKFYTLLSK